MITISYLLRQLEPALRPPRKFSCPIVFAISACLCIILLFESSLFLKHCLCNAAENMKSPCRYFEIYLLVLELPLLPK